MAKVIMTCGNICCGKTTYARALSEKTGAVILSIDEITLALFPEGAGALHDVYVLRAEQYLLGLSLQVLSAGIDVILDWGLWTRAQRDRLRQFYQRHGVAAELHYLRPSREEWENRIQKRNAQPTAGAYYVDEGLKEKAGRLFEEPFPDEVTVVIGDRTGYD